MRVLVCGGRTFGVPKKFYSSDEEHRHDMETRVRPNRKLFLETMNSLCEEFPDIEIISGMAEGADTLAAEYAVAFRLKLHDFAVKDWSRYGKFSGNMRNQEMIDEGKPDLVVAFPGGNGTADMKNRARFSGIELREIE